MPTSAISEMTSQPAYSKFVEVIFSERMAVCLSSFADERAIGPRGLRMYLVGHPQKLQGTCRVDKENAEGETASVDPKYPPVTLALPTFRQGIMTGGESFQKPEAPREMGRLACRWGDPPLPCSNATRRRELGFDWDLLAPGGRGAGAQLAFPPGGEAGRPSATGRAGYVYHCRH